MTRVETPQNAGSSCVRNWATSGKKAPQPPDWIRRAEMVARVAPESTARASPVAVKPPPGSASTRSAVTVP